MAATQLQTPEQIIPHIVGLVQASGYQLTPYDKETYAVLKEHVKNTQNVFKKQLKGTRIWTVAHDALGIIFWLINGEMVIIHPRLIGNYQSKSIYFTDKTINLGFGAATPTSVDKYMSDVFKQQIIPLLTARLQHQNQAVIEYTQEDVRSMKRLEVMIDMARKGGAKLNGSFREMNGIRVFATAPNRAGRVLILHPYGILMNQGGVTSPLISRTASESMAVFEGSQKHFLKAYDHITDANAMGECVKRAFDFRYTVEKDGKKI